MTESLADTWSWREIPLLREAVRGVDAEPGVGIRLREVMAATGLSEADAYAAAVALEDDGWLELVKYTGPRDATRIPRVAGRARQAAGTWPTPQNALDRIVDALDNIAQNTENEEEDRTNAQRFAAWLRNGATTVGLSVASAAITGQLPGAGL